MNEEMKKPTNYIKFKNLPRQRDIVNRLEKRETIPVAFRIDELTYSALDLFAKCNNVTLSALENALHDAFVSKEIMIEHNLYFNDEQCRRNALNLYLDKVAAKLTKMSQAEIMKEYLDLEVRSMAGKLGPEYYNLSKEELLKLYQDYFVNDGPGFETYYNPEDNTVFNVCIGVIDDEDTTVDDIRDLENITEEEYYDRYEEFYGVEHVLTVSEDKWAVVSALLKEYETKFLQLFGEKRKHDFIYRSAGDNPDYVYERDDLKEIVEVINQADVKDVATKLANVLKMPTYVSATKEKK